MAIRYATKNGNWSDVTVWDGGTTLPTASDDVRSNGFTVNIDGSYTVLTVSNNSAAGVVAGGFFELANGVALTCTGNPGIFSSTGGTVILLSLGSGQTATVNSSIQSNYTSTGGQVARNSGSGTLNIVGNITGQSTTGAGGHAVIRNSSSGAINITGNLVPRTEVNNGNAIVTNDSSGTIVVIGNCTGQTGNVNGFGASAYNGAAGVFSITGNITGGGISTHYGAQNASSGIFNINGTCTGNVGYAAVNSSTGRMIVTGSIQSSASAPAVFNSNNSGTLACTGPFLTTALGVSPIQAVRWLWKQTDQQPTYMQVRTQGDLALRNLYTADSVGGNPATNNVRAGTVYGPLNELTGTMAVPSANSVGFGVPVDNTTGTQALSPQDVWNVLTSTLTTNGSIGQRLKNAATVDTVAAQVASLM